MQVFIQQFKIGEFCTCFFEGTLYNVESFGNFLLSFAVRSHNPRQRKDYLTRFFDVGVFWTWDAVSCKYNVVEHTQIRNTVVWDFGSLYKRNDV